jgi:hypothetical protein
MSPTKRTSAASTPSTLLPEIKPRNASLSLVDTASARLGVGATPGQQIELRKQRLSLHAESLQL